MSTIYTDPPEWGAEGSPPPQAKRNAGWSPQNKVPASWLNWFWHRTCQSLQEIANAFVGHRDASAPHSEHETKAGATAKVKAHEDRKTEVHGVETGRFVATTSREDQLVGWGDVQDKPETFPAEPHNHDGRYYSKNESNQRYALTEHGHDADDLPKASTSAPGIVRLTSSRTSTSEELALTAKAMDSHRGSSDHDVRYYTRAQIDQLAPQIVVATGSVGHGETIPLPSGYTQAQCKWLVTPTTSALNQFFGGFRCYADANRKVTAQWYDGGVHEWKKISANYIIIGVK